ncbi:MAG: Sec-independent protein translocase protein TatC [Candidatus Methanoperedenaceae archaeon GB37]|nr:Sec-independent protein translocase protein TatC [Candidatus Methanoperedenaceae archaeon GB37]CAD7782334.1 MAG: Sec-independent protein translocase protein TatC [Candidatus Methanoperedenaceae archaeon GB37]
MSEESKLPFTTHLEELRRRLIYAVVAIVLGAIIAFLFAKQLFYFLAQPLVKILPANQPMIFTALTEAFFTYFKVALLAGFFLASPVVFYQLWKFIAPGLYEHEKKFVIPFVIFATLFFILGGAFAYYIVFPFGFKFFLGFSTDYLKLLPKMSEYFSLSLKLIFAFGIVFEMPVITFFLAKMGVVNGEMLSSKRRYAIVLVFVVAALLTPPDVGTQLLMAGPLILLYEVSVWVARIFGRKSQAPSK